MESDPQAGSNGPRNTLSGIVAGPVVQAGAIHGGVSLGLPRRSVPVPRQLPAVPLRLVDRRAELARLNGILDAGGPAVMMLTGPGGVGKTALAVHWATRRLDRFPDGQLFADLGAFSDAGPVDPAEILTSFLRALDVPPKRIPVHVAEQVALYRTVTATRSLLVLLDNAFSAAQVRTLLPASPAGVTLVTSRTRLTGLVPDGAHTVEVGPLGLDDAIELLTQLVGAERIGPERQQTELVAGACAGLPIALCVAGARLVDRPLLSVARLASELTDETRRLDALSMPEGPSPRAAFEGSYRSLAPDAAALYRRLALHPGVEFGPGPIAALRHAFTDPAPARHAHPDAAPAPARHARTDPAPAVDDAPTGTGVEPLLRANLLQEVHAERFRFHDLVGLHARQKAMADDSAEDRRLALLAILEWYLAAAARADAVLTPYRPKLVYPSSTAPAELPAFPAGPGPARRGAALAWLERERGSLMAAGRAAHAQGHAELAWHLSDVLWPLFLYRKYYRDRLESDHRGVEAARAWGNGWAEARMLKRLGRAYTSIGNHRSAERYTKMAIDRFTDAGDVPGRIEAEEVLAALYAESGRPGRAEEVLTATLLANRELGDARRIGLTLVSLGTLLVRVNRAAAATALLREACDVFGGLPEPDPYNEVRATIALARALFATGDVAGAEAVAGPAAQRMHELGSDYERAEALELLGLVAHRRGRAEIARGHWAEALAIFDALGSAHAAGVQHLLDQLPAGSLDERAQRGPVAAAPPPVDQPGDREQPVE